VYVHGTTTPVPVFAAETGATELTQPLIVSATGTIPGYVEPGQRLTVAVTLGGAEQTFPVEAQLGTETVAEKARAEAAETLLGGKPSLWNKYGLRRFRAFSGDAMFKTVPIVCVGDSITFGQGGNNNTGAPENEPDAAEGWVGQLRKILGSSPQSAAQNPGEGFWFPDESRVTVTGGVSNNWACAALRHAERLIKNTQTLSFTVPAGVTSVGVIQANMPKSFNEAGSKLADVTGSYKLGAGSETALTALTNTGLPVAQFISATGGEVFTVFGPASAQTYIVGFVMRTASSGFLLHRMGQPGYVSGDLLGGQNTGVLNQTEATNQTYAVRATYRWSEPGLIILSFGTNDQNFQSSGGTTAQRGVTLAKYTEWMKQYANQAVADGWCVLILGEPRNPNEPTGAGISSSDEYWGAMKAFALESEHVAFMDVGELWGNNAAATALGLTESNTVHPNRKGHGDIARMVYRAITGSAPVGIAERVPA
jgi:lysophospholipase L1-like esterase